MANNFDYCPASKGEAKPIEYLLTRDFTAKKNSKEKILAEHENQSYPKSNYKPKTPLTKKILDKYFCLTLKL